MEQVSTDRVREILARLEGREIAVLGDVMLDRYFWGTVSRVSPEAPVPVVDIVNESFHLGGAANVAANIRSIGGTAILFGVVGDDFAGKRLRALAEEEGLDPSGIVTSTSRPTTIKTRVIGNNQQLLRLDRETRTDVEADVIREVVEHLFARKNLSAIIVEDYDKGFLCNEMISEIINVGAKRNIPVFVDPKKANAAVYKGCYLFKPNRNEAADAIGKPLVTKEDIIQAGKILLQRVEAEYVLMTLGSEGMMLFARDGSVSSVPTLARKVADVSGAGDTAIAILAAAVAGGATVREASSIANVAAGIVVEEPGIVSVSAAALIEAIDDENYHASVKS